MTMKDYLSLTLEPEDLMGRLSHEVEVHSLSLTDDLSDCPAELTPQAADWYRSQVLPLRSGALEELERNFSSMEFPFLERDRNRIECERLEAIDQARNRFQGDFSKGLENLQKASAAYDDEKKRQPRQREALAWRPWLYWSGILGVITIEALINFEAFEKGLGNVPAMALGLTLGTSFLIGFAAHQHGIFLRQARELFGEHVEATERRSRQFLAGLAALSALVAFGVIYWARSSMFRGLLQIGLGEVSSWSLIWSSASNVGVYIFGILWSAMFHDAIPGYQEKLHRLERQRAYIEKQRKRRLLRVINMCEERARREIEQTEHSHQTASVKSSDRYAPLRGEITKLLKKDADVAALLARYRSELIEGLRGKGQPSVNRTVRCPAKDWEPAKVSLDLDAWATHRIRLPLFFRP